MSYTTGTANDLAALKAAVITACVAAGWSQDAEVLLKGGLALRMRNKVRGAVTGLDFCGGTGSAGGVLAGACPYTVEMATWPASALVYPATYHLFTFTGPDEIYLFVNFSVDMWQWAAWGKSALTLPGSGMWFAAPYSTYIQSVGDGERLYLQPAVNPNLAGESCPGLFMRTEARAPGNAEAFVLHGLDGNTWSTGSTANRAPTALTTANPLLSISPNAWNGEPVLLPINAVVPRGSGLSSSVVQLANARYVRLDNHAPGSVVTLGPDRWMLLPFVRKSSSERNGHLVRNSDIHSGTFGLAVRYDGP